MAWRSRARKDGGRRPARRRRAGRRFFACPFLAVLGKSVQKWFQNRKKLHMLEWVKVMLHETGYRRAPAIEYAHRWAYSRNPAYANFDRMGGDCTNFASQCLFAGCGVMNETKTFGWYYHSLASRAPGWTSVVYLHQFLTTNMKLCRVILSNWATRAGIFIIRPLSWP